MPTKTSDRLVFYTIIAAVVALYIMTSVLIAWRVTTPSDGSRLGLQTSHSTPNTVTITASSTDQNGGLRAGDRVVAVDGQSINYWADALFAKNHISPDWQVGQIIAYTILRDNELVELPVILTEYPFLSKVRGNLPTIILLGAIQMAAGWVFVVRPYERGAQVLFLAAAALATFSLSWFSYMDLAAFISERMLYLYYRSITFLMIVIICASLTHFALLLPHFNANRPIGIRVTMLIYIAPFLYALVYLLIVSTSNSLEWVRRWEPGIWLMFLLYVLFAMIGIISGYRSLDDPIARKRVEVIVLAYILSAFLSVVIAWIPVWINGRSWLGWSVLPLFSLPIVFSLGIAIAFYRLFDIRIVIRQALFWGALTSIVIVTYISVVGMFSIVFRTTENPIFPLIATGIAAVLFQPFRSRLQRRVNRFIYGEPETPYDIIMRLANRLEATLAPNVALNTIVQTVGQTLKLSYSAIELCQDDHYIIVAEYGISDYVPVSSRSHVPLRYGSELVGQLIIAPQRPGEPLTLHDHRLIAGLVVHAEVTIQTIRLTTDLQWAREKLVRAREEERRRLRRDLHDGLGPNLASLTLQIDAARRYLEKDTSRTEQLLGELKSQIQDAVTTVRTLVYDLRPPSLDELGLISALEERARKFEQPDQLIFTFIASPLPELPAAVEGAAYAIALEAITNVARHSQATTCSIRVECTDNLYLEVQDNGRGLSAQHRRGVGIHSMQERAAELGGICSVDNRPGGGTCVRVELPLRLFRTFGNVLKGI